MSFYFKRTKKNIDAQDIYKISTVSFTWPDMSGDLALLLLCITLKKNHNGILLRYFEVPDWIRYCLCLA